MARFIGFPWSKVASVGVRVSAFVSAGVFVFNGNRVPEYLFCISDTSETANFMETAPPNMAPVCETST
jgi:hypothetical protein